MPYSFVHIDKPNGISSFVQVVAELFSLERLSFVEGDTHAIYLLQNLQKLPPDGIRYLEEEQRFTMNVGPNVVSQTANNFIYTSFIWDPPLSRKWRFWKLKADSYLEEGTLSLGVFGVYFD